MKTINNHYSEKSNDKMKGTGRAIHKLRNKYGITIVDLSIKANMSLYALMLAEKGLYTLRLNDICKIVKAFYKPDGIKAIQGLISEIFA